MNESQRHIEEQLRGSATTQLRSPSRPMRAGVMRRIDEGTSRATGPSLLDALRAHRVQGALAFAACLAVAAVAYLFASPSVPVGEPNRSPEMISSLIETTKSSVESAPPIQTIASRAVIDPYRAQGEALLADAQRIYAVLEGAVRPVARVINSGGTGAPTGF